MSDTSLHVRSDGLLSSKISGRTVSKYTHLYLYQGCSGKRGQKSPTTHAAIVALMFSSVGMMRLSFPLCSLDNARSEGWFRHVSAVRITSCTGRPPQPSSGPSEARDCVRKLLEIAGVLQDTQTRANTEAEAF